MQVLQTRAGERTQMPQHCSVSASHAVYTSWTGLMDMNSVCVKKTHDYFWYVERLTGDL